MSLRSIKYIVNRYLLRRDTLLAKSDLYDLQLAVKTEDVVGRHLYKYGAHERETTDFLIQTLQLADNDIVLDIGANLGWYSLIFDRMAGAHDIDIYAFEPEPTNFALLENNVARNRAGHIRAQQLAVADEPGQMTLHMYKSSNRGRHSLLAIHDGQTVDVQTVTLDGFWEAEGLGDRVPRFIKMDIEGFELMALRGASNVLRRCPMVMLEYTPEAMRAVSLDPGHMLDLMGGQGFAPQVLKGGRLEGIDIESLRSSSDQVDLFWTR